MSQVSTLCRVISWVPTRLAMVKKAIKTTMSSGFLGDTWTLAPNVLQVPFAPQKCIVLSCRYIYIYIIIILLIIVIITITIIIMIINIHTLV